MKPLGVLLLLSPLLPIALSFFLRARPARLVARLAPLPWALTMPPVIWLAADCSEDDFAYYNCTRTPQALADLFGGWGLLAYMSWVAVGPVLLGLALLLERSRRS